jgi:hypothetical protein
MTYFILSFCFFSTLLAQSTPSDILRMGGYRAVSGKLNEKYFHSFDKSLREGRPIFLSSSGGDAQIALKIAKLIKVNHPTLKIGGVCLSACAEIILPSAIKYSEFSFQGEPLIGFHQNSEIFRRNLSSNSKILFSRCLQDLNHDFLKFQKDVNIKQNSIDFQIMALLPRKSSASISNDCESSTIELYRKYWFPSSDQLKSIYGMIVPGRVCADTPMCIERVLSVIGKNGDRFVVGELEYTIAQNEIGVQKVFQSGNVSFNNKVGAADEI